MQIKIDIRISFIILAILCSAAASEIIHMDGELTQDSTWCDTVVLEGTVTVPAGVVLNIEPGTTVSMMDSVSLIVYGQLIADGSEAEPIRFTRFDDNTAWKQIMFIEAADSRFTHCIIEYADSEGEHQDYYEPGPRTYHEAVVALASHLDIERCIFQNLPDDSDRAQGDAIAIISDDPNTSGEASAHIRGSRFLSIGQGVHTRFSYVLVEDCFFTGKRGDNDDVDLWGESTPPPQIRNNLFLDPEHDDMINPTRCSAIITGNVIVGSDDHGVVLRDRCFPVMMNNLIIDCRNAGIAVENSCQALLVNNTIVDCGRGLRLFDLGRWGSPYNLNPGGGTATVINCIIWDCLEPVTLTDSSNTQIEDPGSHITISYSDIESGLDGVSVTGDLSTITWGEDNINIDPQFADPNSADYHLKSQAGRWDPNSGSWVKDDVTSPCIDTGDPNSDWTSEIWPHGDRINMGAYGGTPEASMSIEAEGMSLPRVAYFYDHDITTTNSFKSLLEMYGVSVTSVSVNNLKQVSLVDYDLIIVGDDAAGPETFEDGQFVAAVEESGKPVLGLGDGGYDFFGRLGLSVGYPNGAHSSVNTISVIDPNHALFGEPYPIEIPQDQTLQLYTQTDHVTLYFNPVPDTVTVLAGEVDNPCYYPIALEHNRYLLWGFTESPENMTATGRRVFINTVIFTANSAR